MQYVLNRSSEAPIRAPTATNNRFEFSDNESYSNMTSPKKTAVKPEATPLISMMASYGTLRQGEHAVDTPEGFELLNLIAADNPHASVLECAAEGPGWRQEDLVVSATINGQPRAWMSPASSIDIDDDGNPVAVIVLPSGGRHTAGALWESISVSRGKFVIAQADLTGYRLRHPAIKLTIRAKVYESR